MKINLMVKTLILSVASLLTYTAASAQNNVVTSVQNGVNAVNNIASIIDASQGENATPMAMNLLGSLQKTVMAGVVVGVNFGGAAEEGKTGSALERFNVGFTTRIGLPLGFALQPSIMYTTKKISVKDVIQKTSLLSTVGFIEVPVQLQWGLNLKNNFRPFIFAEPFIGYGITQKNKLFGDSFNLEDILSGNLEEVPDIEIPEIPDMQEVKDNLVKKMEYGLGGGLGIAYGPVQLSVKYYRNMGKLYLDDANEGVKLGEAIKTAMKDKNYISGFTVSLGLVF